MKYLLSTSVLLAAALLVSCVTRPFESGRLPGDSDRCRQLLLSHYPVGTAIDQIEAEFNGKDCRVERVRDGRTIDGRRFGDMIYEGESPFSVTEHRGDFNFLKVGTTRSSLLRSRTWVMSFIADSEENLKDVKVVIWEYAIF